MPPGYLLSELNELFIPQLDSSLSEERPAFDGLKPLLVFRTPEPVSIEIHIGLWGRTGTLSSGILPGPLCRELPRSHLLQRHICKFSLQEITTYCNKSQIKQKWRTLLSNNTQMLI